MPRATSRSPTTSDPTHKADNEPPSWRFFCGRTGDISMNQLILPRSVRRAYTKDGLMTFDAQTIDSAGSFLIGELERLDQTLHAPLAAVTWGRDIQLREDVSIADEVSSFTNSTFAAAG